MESRVEYFVSGSVSLSIECFLPEHPSSMGHVFYSGGGWVEDNRYRFRRYATELAEQGIAVFLPQYRVYGCHRTEPKEGMEDVMEGLTLLERLYPKYGISREGLSWGGGSAGGQLVLTASLVRAYRRRQKSLPAKLVLFNPVCCCHSLTGWVQEQVGVSFDFTGMCPLCDMETESRKLPVILAMHGTKDGIAPPEDLNKFKVLYEKIGGECRLRMYEGRGHGFHHPEISKEDYRSTLEATLHFLKGEQT
ncbi:MAG: alpha/beta hydrolase fold domain-containing protein [Lachnospiraceae bacterium]|nr:alpha/beta hydrolase fold domain-containing protein [Lachnospiraceae bacterium]